MDAIVLAGGKGTRMENPIPKILIPIRGRAMLEYQLDFLAKVPDLGKIVFAVGYEADKVREYVKENHPDKNIEFSVETEPLGTGGAIKQALTMTTSEFVLVFNGDQLTDLDVNKLVKNKSHTICVTHPRLPFGRVKEVEGYATFEEKPLLDDWVSMGFYLFNRNIDTHLPVKGSIEYEVFPKIKLKLFKHEGFWRALDSKKHINEIEEKGLPSSLKEKHL